MPRIFSRPITVSQDDIDIQGHVNNLRYLAWMQDVAVAHSRAQGWPMSRYLACGAGWVVRSHSITYKRPAFLGEELTAYTWVSGFSARQCPRKYLFWRAADQCVLAQAETLWVFVNLSTGRPTRVPEDLRTAFDIVADETEVLALARGAG